MTATYKTKLIEVALPLEAILKESALRFLQPGVRHSPSEH